MVDASCCCFVLLDESKFDLLLDLENNWKAGERLVNPDSSWIASVRMQKRNIGFIDCFDRIHGGESITIDLILYDAGIVVFETPVTVTRPLLEGVRAVVVANQSNFHASVHLAIGNSKK